VPLLICRLEERHVVEHFDCGDHALNDYIRQHAWKNQVRYLVGVTHVATDEKQPELVIGYYTLASTVISRDLVRVLSPFGGLPYQDIPAVLLARLGVDRRFAGCGVGKALLVDALNRALELRQTIGCRCVIVDAYPGAVAWYAKYGFLPISGGSPTSPTQKMCIDLRTVQKAKQ